MDIIEQFKIYEIGLVGTPDDRIDVLAEIFRENNISCNPDLYGREKNLKDYLTDNFLKWKVTLFEYGYLNAYNGVTADDFMQKHTIYNVDEFIELYNKTKVEITDNDFMTMLS